MLPPPYPGVFFLLQPDLILPGDDDFRFAFEEFDEAGDADRISRKIIFRLVGKAAPVVRIPSWFKRTLYMWERSDSNALCFLCSGFTDRSRSSISTAFPNNSGEYTIRTCGQVSPSAV